ncbi:MAG: hypothetical protein AAFV26_07895, partial [Pseudomonadota bacterium]
RVAKAKHTELQAENEAAVGALAVREAELDAAGAAALSALEKDAAWQQVEARYAELEQRTGRAEERIGEAEQEREEKRRAFEGDPLFMYLWRRRYRQSGYEASAIIRWLDGKVARLVGYNDARANYAYLLTLPERIEAHRDRVEAERDAIRSKRDELVSAETAKRLPDTFEAMHDEAAARVATSDAGLNTSEAELAEIAEALNSYAEGKDAGYAEAIEALATSMEQQRIKELRAEVRRTKTPTDDEIVAEISKLDRRAGKLKGEIAETTEKIEEFADRREALIRLASDFRRKNYHRPKSEFEWDDDFDDLIENVARGALHIGELWLRAQMGQRWGRGPGDSYRRSKGISWGGLGGGGGGGRRRGGRGGSRGGFRTGGGF